jgi:hypothetical protein
MVRAWRIGLFVAVLIVIAATLALWYRARGSGRALDISTRARAIHQAFIVYAQNFGGKSPPPDRAAAIFVECGLVSAEIFDVPGTPRGEASFYFIPTTPNTERWASSFSRSEPVLYTNPAASHGIIHVAWNDNHVETLDEKAAAPFLAEYGGRAIPLKYEGQAAH